MPRASVENQWETSEIIALREATKKTQQDFAVLLGVTVATVSRWETGKVLPMKHIQPTLDRIAKRFGFVRAK